MRYIGFGKILKTVLLAGAIVLICPGFSFAQTLREQVLLELRNAKETGRNFEAQLSKAEEEQQKILSQIDFLNRKQSEIDQQISKQKVTERILEKQIRKTGLEVKTIARQLYKMLNRDVVLTAVFASEDLTDLLGKLAEQNLMISKGAEKLAEQQKKQKDLIIAKEENRAELLELLRQKEQMQQQKKELFEKKKSLVVKLEENKQKQLLLEQKYASLAETQNQRDFISLNISQGDSVTFVGGGTEHGLGMSQYGARGFAEHGFNYKQILGHYFQGTSLKKIDTSGEKIRVRITQPNPKPEDYFGTLENIGGEWINTVLLEEYLRGVVAAEVSANWPQEALRAQAVAARSYAIAHLDSKGFWDVDDTTCYQVYLGKYTFSETDRAVRETAGEVLTYDGIVIPAYYHSTSGGWTENNENVWGGEALAWLRGVESPFEQDSPHWYWLTKAFSFSELSQIFSADEKTSVGEVQKIEIVSRGISGRVLAIKITGTSGEKIVSGQVFKTVFNKNAPGENYLRSTLFGIK